MKKILTFTLFAASALSACKSQEEIGELADRVAAVAVEQCLQMEERLTEDTMPRSVKDGDFLASGLEWWCSGFYPGTCWYTYLLSGDERVKDLAIRQTHKLSDLSKVYFNHDIPTLGRQMVKMTSAIASQPLSPKALLAQMPLA